MWKECYLISNNFLQALFQVLCIKITISSPKIHNHSKMWKAHPHSLKKVKLSRRKIQFVIYFKQQTHFLFIPKRQNNSNNLFPCYIKSNQDKTKQQTPRPARPKATQSFETTGRWSSILVLTECNSISYCLHQILLATHKCYICFSF